MAIRASLGFSSSSTTTKNPTTPTPAGQLEESDLSDLSFSIIPGFQYYLLQTGALAGYAGGQIAFTTSSRNRTGSATDAVGFAKDHEYSKSTTRFGFAVFGGFEWFPWERISFSGEYRLGFGTESGTQESKTANTTTKTDAPSVTSFGISSGTGANLTLSVYL
jgi:opacity protein-like surface antigen